MAANKRNLLTMSVIGAGLILFAWFNGLPHNSRASSGVMDDYVMYGIESDSAALLRYNFAESELSTVGTIRLGNGSVLTGIEATAYIPGYTNIYGFWKDDADGESKLIYINAMSARATLVGGSLGPVNIEGATAVNDGGGWGMYAVENPSPVTFDIEGGRVVPGGQFAVKLTVLGADISYGGQYEEPVTVKLRVGENYYEPFGPLDLALTGNIHDHTVHESIVQATHVGGSNVSVIGRNWIKKSGEDGSEDSEWEIRNTVTSTDDVPEVIVLRNGDAVPNITPFLDQAEIVDFIEAYVDFDSNTVVLGDHQVIYLFELGSGGASSSSADFQDLVVLVTLGHSEEELGDEQALNSRLVRVDHTTGVATEVMPLSREYSALASVDGGLFYASSNDEVYAIDTAAQTETLAGVVVAGQMDALEYVALDLMGFDTQTNKVAPLNLTGTPFVGTPVASGVTDDIKTIIFTSTDSDPAEVGVSYD